MVIGKSSNPSSRRRTRLRQATRATWVASLVCLAAPGLKGSQTPPNRRPNPFIGLPAYDAAPSVEGYQGVGASPCREYSRGEFRGRCADLHRQSSIRQGRRAKACAAATRIATAPIEGARGGISVSSRDPLGSISLSASTARVNRSSGGLLHITHARRGQPDGLKQKREAYDCGANSHHS